jgi:iron-sulfur cluster repair protein YtfE (RIC family)
MLTSISAGTSASNQEEIAFGLLMGCHERIRYFTAMSSRLATAEDQPAPQIEQAAGALVRYFTVSLPLHEADENESLHPRLRSAASAAVAAASEEMVRQHAGIDAVVAELLPLWEKVQREPHQLHNLAAAMAENTCRLQELWDTHLKLEEQTVFPAMQQFLSPQELETIREEMHRRRAQ